MVTKQPVDDNAGSKRATDFHNAMLGLPGYGDDSMMYILRYVVQVKQKLRQCDFEEFMKYFNQLGSLWPEANQEAAEPEGGNSRYERAQELKRLALGKIQDHPDLVRDFEQFASSGRAVTRTFGALEKK
ncbi:hypothetical protein B0T10DRAFT_463823 [Thelonectria olida]|uniref:Uncharacterized protein n=1 Tax=Thelonectria olida TaxID=1576542 RepID=A0A9P9ALE5_9HYPO|nr:hypothetical protein B0T10DRAFT_463823 [Thelonectria olida]